VWVSREESKGEEKRRKKGETGLGVCIFPPLFLIHCLENSLDNRGAKRERRGREKENASFSLRRIAGEERGREKRRESHALFSSARRLRRLASWAAVEAEKKGEGDLRF